MVKNPKRPKREDAAQSAFRALQHVIETTEGKKPAPKRKSRQASVPNRLNIER
jgi:hypothetical protein